MFLSLLNLRIPVVFGVGNIGCPLGAAPITVKMGAGGTSFRILHSALRIFTLDLAFLLGAPQPFRRCTRFQVAR